VRGERGAHRGAQVGAVEPGAVKLGGKPGDQRGERAAVSWSAASRARHMSASVGTANAQPATIWRACSFLVLIC
jgi:hypothetical protein